MVTSNIGITAVGQIAIAVDDVGTAVEFYRDVLGLGVDNRTYVRLVCGYAKPEPAGQAGKGLEHR